jgi:AcrR family transcriptional regulator
MRLVEAASSLLDAGGPSAVTLRAVAQAVGVSHNAPYKHFDDRGAILAAVATRDCDRLTASLDKIQRAGGAPLRKLNQALKVFAAYGAQFPARYRLLFGDPDIATRGGELEVAAMALFKRLALIVEECQGTGLPAGIATPELAVLIYSSVHGLIDLRASGRLRKEKGIVTVEEGIDLLVRLLAPSARSLPHDRVPAS